MGNADGAALWTCLRQLHDGNGAVGAGDREAAGAKLDVLDRRLEMVGRDLFAALDHLPARLDDRRSARHDRFRAAGAAAGDQLVAVALQQADALERHAELAGQHLGERRGVALAVVERAGDDRDRAIGLKAYAAHLVLGRRRDLEIVADAAAAQLPPCVAVGPARREAVPVGGRERPVEQRRELAAVVGRGDRRRVGHLRRLDVVAPPQRHRVDAELARRRVDQSLHVVVALGPAGAAIGADDRGVGEHDLHG